MRRVTAVCCRAAAAVMVLAIAGQRAMAAGPDYPRDVVEGASACPEPRAVWSALSALVGEDRLEARLRTLPGDLPTVAVTDLGTAFRVRAGDQAREYQDEPRDCANRAKLAALFVTLAVDSVEHTNQARAPGPAVSPPPPVVRQEPGPPPSKLHVAYLELGVDGRFGVRPWTAAPGVLAQVARGRRRFALVLGVRGTLPTDMTMAGIRVRQWRASADVALRARFFDGRPVTSFVELGAVAALLSVQAPDLATGGSHAGGELGFAAGGGISFRQRSWGAAFVLVEAEIDPDPPALSALPTGGLGRTPYVWLGAAVGLSVGLF